MKMILGKKIGMTRIFEEDGTVVPVTLITAGPCFVTQIKTKEKDGYDAVQIGFDKTKKNTKPQVGHLKKAGKELVNLKFVREFKINNPERLKDFKEGQEINVGIFKKGDQVTVTGVSKGKGFTGVMKRYGFHGSPKTHGHKHDHRAPGSIGASFPEHVLKGMKMAGRMGNKRVTIKNLKVVDVDEEKKILALKGAVPGARNSLVLIKENN